MAKASQGVGCFRGWNYLEPIDLVETCSEINIVPTCSVLCGDAIPARKPIKLIDIACFECSPECTLESSQASEIVSCER